MDFKIVKEKDFPLLARKRYEVAVEHTANPTPSKENIKKELASFLKEDEEHIAVRHLYTKFGVSSSKAIVHVYGKKEDKERLEKKKVKKEHAKKESKKQGAK